MGQVIPFKHRDPASGDAASMRRRHNERVLASARAPKAQIAPPTCHDDVSLEWLASELYPQTDTDRDAAELHSDVDDEWPY